MNIHHLPGKDPRRHHADVLTVARTRGASANGEAGTGQIIDWQDLGGSSPTRFLFQGGKHGASVSVFVVDFSPGQGPPLHRHPYEEVFVVHEGLARFTAGEESLEAEVGQVVIVPAGTPHKFVNAGEGRLRLMSVHPRPHIELEWLEG